MKYMIILTVILSSLLQAAQPGFIRIHVSQSCPSSPQQMNKPCQPNILGDLQDVFWYEHCLKSTCTEESKGIFNLRLDLNTSSGERVLLMKGKMILQTSSEQPYYEVKDLSLEYEPARKLLPVLYARILDMPSPARGSNQHFAAPSKYSSLFTNFGCTGNTSPLIADGFLMFSMDPAKKIAILIAHNKIKANRVTSSIPALLPRENEANIFFI